MKIVNSASEIPGMTREVVERFLESKLNLQLARNSTPTSGWQWTHVKFSNPSSRANITDWFGLNTGDVRIVMKKNLSDSLQLPLIDGRDSDNFDSHATIEFIESMPTRATLANIPSKSGKIRLISRLVNQRAILDLALLFSTDIQ
jgi:hypothetical protein